MATGRRRGEDGISFEHRGPCRDPDRHRHCPGLWRGEFTLGYTGDGPPAQLVEVPVLDTGVAAGYLVERTGDDDVAAAVGVAEEVGGLPLALEQAAAYIQASGDTLAGYLALFRRRRPDLLARGGPEAYPGTVATTWALAFGQLEQAAPGAAGLLRLLAFCTPDAIPLGLLLQSRPRLTEQIAGRGGTGAGAVAGR